MEHQIELLCDALLTFCPSADDLIPPDGYRDSGIALVDAVFSMQANYGSVRAVVQRYAQFVGIDPAPLDPAAHEPDQHSVEKLAQILGAMSAERAAADIFQNSSKSARADRLKAELVQEVASRLLGIGVSCRDDVAFDEQSPSFADQKRAWTEVRGLGSVTFEYFRLLCGAETVKPDVMVLGWIDEVTGTRPSVSEGHRLMRALAGSAADRWGIDSVSLRALDHTVWLHQSGRLET